MKRHPVVAASVASYLVSFTVFGLATGSRLTVPYVVMVALGALGVAFLDSRVGLTRTALVGLALWGAGHLAGGIVELDGDRILYNGLFTRWIHFDNVVHFVGFGASGMAAWEAIRGWLDADRPRPSRPLVVVVVALLGMGVGALNEVVEFASTHLLPETEVGGYENTGRDLVANMLGGLSAGWLVVRRGRPRGGRRDPHRSGSAVTPTPRPEAGPRPAPRSTGAPG